MEWSRSTWFTAAFVLLLPRLCSPAGDQLELGESLLPGQIVVSDGGAFALGFFFPSNATPRRQYIGIWYNNIPERTVVWVGNRDAPIIVDEPSGNTSSSSSTSLALANDTSNLVLLDASGRVVWTTNITATTSSGTANSTAVLLNTGHLVLWSPNGTTLWQSFDHLTDTLLPDMKVGLRHRPMPHTWRIVSWKGPTSDPSPGSFTYGIDPDTLLQMFVWKTTTTTTRPYWRSAPWTGYMTISRYYPATGTGVYVAVVDGEDEVYMSFSVNDGASPTRYVVDEAGRFQLLGWSRNASAWAALESWSTSACSPYATCGPYGYCDLSDGAATCRCLDGFAPASREEWSGGVFSKGCRRVQALAPCGGEGANGDEFVAFRNMKVPDKFVLVGNKSSDAECAAECSRDCACVAYAFANLRSSSAKGDVSRCLMWTGELLDAQMIGERRGVTAETFYLRVPSGGRPRTNILKIVLPVVAGVLMLACILLICFCKFKGKKRRRNDSEKKLVSGSSVRTSSDLGEGNPTEDLEFPSIQFRDIVAATNNFSRTCLIDRRGFGKVYNVIF